jgi:hypothetical protein
MNAFTKTKQQARENTRTGLDTVSTTTVAVMGTVSAVIGLWALATLVSAMVNSGGLLGLARGWFQAVSGM